MTTEQTYSHPSSEKKKEQIVQIEHVISNTELGNQSVNLSKIKAYMSKGVK